VQCCSNVSCIRLVQFFVIAVSRNVWTAEISDSNVSQMQIGTTSNCSDVVVSQQLQYSVHAMRHRSIQKACLQAVVRMEDLERLGLMM